MEVNFILLNKNHSTKVSQGCFYIDILEVEVLVWMLLWEEEENMHLTKL